jgi:hypothetical protein
MIPATPDGERRNSGYERARRASSYRPNFPALLSRNKLPTGMYCRTIWTDLCPV